MPDQDLVISNRLRDRLGLPPAVEPIAGHVLDHAEGRFRQMIDDLPGLVSESTTGNGIIARSGGPGSGLFATSTSGPGLRGESTESHGLVARSHLAAALWADTAADAPGVIGTSTGGQGVWGESSALNRCGVAGVGNSGHGVVGETRSPHHAGLTARGPEWAGRFEGKVHVLRDLLVDGDVVLAGADLAEEFSVVEDERDAEPGTVMVLAGADALRVSTTAYDTRVAGVLSGAGTYRPAVVMDRNGPGRRALAMSGKVWVFASNENGAIDVGDLLTTAALRGHAMRATRRERSHGAIIGKALDPLGTATGLIRALVTLH